MNSELLNGAFKTMAHAAAIVVFEVKQARVVEANDAFTLFVGVMQPDELKGSNLFTDLLADGTEDTVDDLRQVFVQNKSGALNLKLNTKLEGVKKVRCHVSPLLSSKNHFVVSIEDETDLAIVKAQLAESRSRIDNLRARLEQLSKIDSLTGVYNPKAINHELSILFNSAKRNYGSFSILFIEVDRLAEIEKSHGEKMVKKCIEHFAINLTRNFRRRSDIIIRYSVNQFLVCFAGANDAQTYNLADKILRAINNIPVLVDETDEKIQLSISVGMVNVVLNLDSSLDHTIGEANLAVEKAKKHGGNQIFVSEINQV